MRRHLNCLLLAVSVLGLANQLIAQDAEKKPATAPTKSGEGTLVIGGKTYKVEHVVAYESKVFDDNLISVTLADKPLPMEKIKTALREGKGTDDKIFLFQPHTKITFGKDGKPMFSNSYADNASLSVSGSLKGELKVKDGRVIGNASMKTGDEDKGISSFDVRFDVELIPAVVVPADPKPEPSDKPKTKSKTKTKDDPAKGDAKTTSDQPNVKDVIPKVATDVELKKLVEQIAFKSPSDVKTMVDALTKQLEEEKWTKSGGDLVTPKSAILNRKNGKASLTIFVKPTDAGSTVTMMTKGLSWEEKKPAAKTEPAADDEAPARGILASRFPVPEKSQELERDANIQLITFRTSLKTKEVADFYRKKLKPLGWKEDTDETLLIEEAETGALTFKKGEDSFRVLIQPGKPKSASRVVIEGEGVIWADPEKKSDEDSAKPSKDQE